MPILETGEDSGFTLIEVLAVMVLLGFILVLAYPSYLLGEERAQIKYMGSLITSDIKLIQEDSSYNKSDLVMVFTKNGYSFELGQTHLTRSFQRYGFSFMVPEEKESENTVATVSPEETAKPVPSESPGKKVEPSESEEPSKDEKPEAGSCSLIFAEDGIGTDFELNWQTNHFTGSLSLNKDGTVNWHYERK